METLDGWVQVYGDWCVGWGIGSHHAPLELTHDRDGHPVILCHDCTARAHG